MKAWAFLNYWWARAWAAPKSTPIEITITNYSRVCSRFHAWQVSGSIPKLNVSGIMRSLTNYNQDMSHSLIQRPQYIKVNIYGRSSFEVFVNK